MKIISENIMMACTWTQAIVYYM